MFIDLKLRWSFISRLKLLLTFYGNNILRLQWSKTKPFQSRITQISVTNNNQKCFLIVTSVLEHKELIPHSFQSRCLCTVCLGLVVSKVTEKPGFWLSKGSFSFKFRGNFAVAALWEIEVSKSRRLDRQRIHKSTVCIRDPSFKYCLIP